MYDARAHTCVASQDYFNVMYFNHEVLLWNKHSFVRATEENKKLAIDFVKAEGIPSGYTDIGSAYASGFDLFEDYLEALPGELPVLLSFNVKRV